MSYDSPSSQLWEDRLLSYDGMAQSVADPIVQTGAFAAIIPALPPASDSCLTFLLHGLHSAHT
jgi:hypothetical protein